MISLVSVCILFTFVSRSNLLFAVLFHIHQLLHYHSLIKNDYFILHWIIFEDIFVWVRYLRITDHHHHHNIWAHMSVRSILCPLYRRLLLSQFLSWSSPDHHPIITSSWLLDSAALLLVCCLSCRRLRLSPAAVRRCTTTVFFVILLPHLTNMETYNKFVAAKKTIQIQCKSAFSLSNSIAYQWVSERSELCPFWMSKK